MAQALEHHRAPRKLVLCFDGTGNKFRGDDSDSNILKIFRCLDREAGDQCRSCFTATSYDLGHTDCGIFQIITINQALAHTLYRPRYLTRVWAREFGHGI